MENGRPETPEEWMHQAAQHLADALYSLNCSEVLAFGHPDKPYGQAQAALIGTLTVLMNGDAQAADAVFDIWCDCHESVKYCMGVHRRHVMDSHRREDQFYVGDRVLRDGGDRVYGEVGALAMEGEYRVKWDDGTVTTVSGENMTLIHSVYDTLEI